MRTTVLVTSDEVADSRQSLTLSLLRHWWRFLRHWRSFFQYRLRGGLSWRRLHWRLSRRLRFLYWFHCSHTLIYC